MIRVLIISFVLGAAVAVGAGFLITGVANGGAVPVNQSLYNYGTR